jgi:hypothetical protein
MKKLNNKTKLLLTALATLGVVDLWRDFAWVKKAVAAFASKEKEDEPAA